MRTMLPKERVLTAIAHQLPDRIPTDAIHIENTWNIAKHLNVPEASVLGLLGIDGRIVSAPYIGAAQEPINGIRVTEWQTPDTGDYSTYRHYPLAGIDSVHELSRHHFPQPSQYDYAIAREHAKELDKVYAVRGPYWKPLFCQVCDLVGMEDALIMLKSDTVLFEAILDRVFEHTYEYCRQLLDTCGEYLPILCLGDDFATQRGLMLDPVDWRRYLLPRFADLFALGKSANKVVWFHSCGDITAVLPQLIDIGMDVWETVQLHTLPMNPSKLKKEYGRHITFFGGVNTQRLPFMSPQEVAAETTRVIEALGAGGGYICGPDHHIKPDVSAEATLQLFDTARAFRKFGYTL